MSDIRAKLLAAFVVEHKEYLEGIRAVLRKLDEAGGATRAELDEVFRLAHSLKAAARVCDLATTAAIGERLEAIFGQVRKGTLRLGNDSIRVIHTALGAIESWSSALEDQPHLREKVGEGEQAAVVATLDKVLNTSQPKASRPAATDDLTPKLLAAFQIEHKEHLEGIRTLLAGIDNGGKVSSAHVDEAFRRAHSLKGAARLADMRPAETLAHRLETLFARVREGTLQLGTDVVRVIHQGLNAIEDWAACMLDQRPLPEAQPALEAIDKVLTSAASQLAPVPATPASMGPAGSERQFPAVETMRVSADNLDRLLRSTGQLLTENLRQGLVTRELTGLSRQIDAIEKDWETLRNTSTAALRQLSATPGLARIAQFVTGIEQQMRGLARQARQVRMLQQRSSWTLGLLGGQLQQDVRRVRMVSAESVFQGFRKMMRDLARDEGKEIDFRVSGLETEADRLVLQALKDPLMHILCNAVSHGIEAPHERQDRGKHEVGHVALSLAILGNRLRIAVEDDGRGIDHQRVAAAAVRGGFLSAAEAEAATPAELARVIFQPGLSTSRQVTDVAGRGMGLSVAYEAVARLQGEIDLQPGAQSGTRLELTVPLAIATQRLLLVTCAGQCFAIPVHAVEQLLRLKIQDIETVEGKPMLLVQGQPLPLLSLAHLLKFDSGDLHIVDDFVLLVVMRSGNKRVAVAVERLVAERDSLVKDLDDPAAQLATFAGGILLEDGSVALVLNPGELLKSYRPGDKVPALKTTAAVSEKRMPTVLVVDDSLTTRTLEKSLLEAHGYRVRIAMDGVEALNQLQGELPDLVITDIQMPRLDGFGLLEEMKKNQRLARVPVIVVTSMERREDQERGLALGADAYIVKRKFDHQELLAAIRQIV